MHIMMRSILSVLLMRCKLIKPHSALMCAVKKNLGFIISQDFQIENCMSTSACKAHPHSCMYKFCNNRATSLENKQCGFRTVFDTNWAVQVQKMARGWKF